MPLYETKAIWLLCPRCCTDQLDPRNVDMPLPAHPHILFGSITSVEYMDVSWADDGKLTKAQLYKHCEGCAGKRWLDA